MEVTPLRRLHLIRAAKAAHLLLKEKASGGRIVSQSPPAAPGFRTQPRPRGTLIADQRRACAARPKGKYSRERMALAPIRARRIFPATGAGGAAGGQGHSQFSSNRLSRHTQVLCYFPCTPRATALRQARVSGGNLQNCAPSAACGGAMTQERNVILRPFPVFPAYAISSISYSRVPMPSFSPCSRPACQLVSGKSAVK